MLRRSLFVSALILAGVVGFASSAKAQVNGAVNLSGEVLAACTFGADTDGVLAVEDSTNKKLVTNNPATITVNCSTGTLQITNISTAVSGSAPTPEVDLNIQSNLISGANTTTTTKNAGTIAPGVAVAAPLDGETVSVNLNAVEKANAALGAGTYDFTVTVTATK